MSIRTQPDHVLDDFLSPADANSRHQISLLSLLEVSFRTLHRML